MRYGLGRRRRRQQTVSAVLLAVTGVALLVFWWWLATAGGTPRAVKKLEEATLPDWVNSRLIPVGTARSGQSLEDFSAVVIHYVGNPGTSAINNRNYFAKADTTVSAHFVVGLEGEVIQCLPLWERSAASNHRNRDTVSIEVCHPDAGGEFSPLTYASVVRLTAWLCEIGGLDQGDVIRHYDVTGKQCPLYYVQHEEAWQQLRADVASRLE